MTPLQLQETILLGEGPSVEFKRCGNQPESDTFETICSFSNRNGGSIYLGVTDSGDIVGVPQASLLSIKRNIVNVTNNENVFSPAVVTEFEEIQVGDKTVLRVWVPMSSSIHRYKKMVYDRVEDADIRVETTDGLAGMYLRKQNVFTEQRIFPYLTDSDLALDRMGEFRRRAYAKHADHPWKQMSDREILKSMRLYAMDYASGEEGYTLAAALLMGRDDVIASVCPAYKTDVIIRIDNTERYDDRLCTSTNLIDAHVQICKFISAYLPDRFHLEQGQAISPRDIIVREVVTNSLIHREYISPRPARIIIDREKLVADNASRASFQGALSPQNSFPTPKNPTIAKFFNQIGLAEELGSGVPTLFRYSQAYTGANPTLTEGDVFKTVIPLSLPKAGEPMTPGKSEKHSNSSADPNLTIARDAALHEAHEARMVGLPTDASPRMAAVNRTDSVYAAAREVLSQQPFLTVKDICAILGLSPRTAQRELAKLVEQGLLAAEGRTRGKTYRLP